MRSFDRRANRLLGGLLLAGSVAGSAGGCGGGASTPPPVVRTPPNLTAFLRLPVATPSSCPSSVAAAASGRRSPWVGHVDVSVFIAAHARPAAVAALGRQLRALPAVRAVYAETRAQAYAEFQRLYTCSDRVRPGELRASYRLVLHAVTHVQRDDLVRSVLRMPAVSDVTCDPSDPCVQLSPGG